MIKNMLEHEKLVGLLTYQRETEQDPKESAEEGEGMNTNEFKWETASRHH